MTHAAANACHTCRFFTEAVAHGEAALERGDSLTHEQVGERLGRFLRT